jgi:hypothetical protein
MRKILMDVGFIGQDINETYWFDIKYVQVRFITVPDIVSAIGAGNIYHIRVKGNGIMDACRNENIEILTTLRDITIKEDD